MLWEGYICIFKVFNRFNGHKTDKTDPLNSVIYETSYARHCAVLSDIKVKHVLCFLVSQEFILTE